MDGEKSWKKNSEGLSYASYSRGFTSLSKPPTTLSPIPLGSNHFGVYKTIDGAKTWKNIFPEFNCSSLAIALDSTVYAGGYSYSWSERGGIFKSINGGKTWNALHDGNHYVHFGILSLAVDPHHPGRVYVGTEGNGVFMGEPN